MKSLILIPEEFLNEIKAGQEKILSIICHQDQSTDYITENQAKDIFKRKTTWFWQMRKQGLLPFSKIGKTIYYSKTDIKKIFDTNKTI